MSTQCLPGGLFRCKKTISRMRHPNAVALICSCDPGTFISVTVVDIPLTLVPIPPGRVAQSVGHLTRKSGVLGSIPGLATYFRFSFRFFKKGSCQFLAKVCARSTG